MPRWNRTWLKQLRRLRRHHAAMLGGRRVPVRGVGPLQRRGQPRPFRHHRVVPRIRHAAVGGDPQSVHHGAAASAIPTWCGSEPAIFTADARRATARPASRATDRAADAAASARTLPSRCRHGRAGALFWIVKNGLKYTGMPAWVAPQRDDEVWAVVAFLRAAAAPWTRPRIARWWRECRAARRRARDLDELRQPDRSRSPPAAAATATRPAPPTNGFTPKLAGQSPRYLAAAMEDYADGSAAERHHAADRRRGSTPGRSPPLADYYAGPVECAARPPRGPPEQTRARTHDRDAARRGAGFRRASAVTSAKQPRSSRGWPDSTRPTLAGSCACGETACATARRAAPSWRRSHGG